MSSRGLRVVSPVFATLLALGPACAPATRQLTPRVVEDPIVLPRKMVHLSGGVGELQTEPSGERRLWTRTGLRVGLTDRLEWSDILQLRYALLDDRPVDGRLPRPLSLALQAGFRGVGWSSLQGTIVYPTAALQALKHVGDRWALATSFTWLATVMERGIPPFSYTEDLGYSAGRRSYWTLEADITRQLTERFALFLGPWVTRVGACLSLLCDPVVHSTGASLHLVFRPSHWLTLRAGPYAGLRYRPDTLPPPGDPSVPAPIPPTRVEWLGVSVWLAFHW